MAATPSATTARTAAAHELSGLAATEPRPTMSLADADIPTIMASLPTETGCPPYLLHQYQGFWATEFFLRSMARAHACFKSRPTDIFLTSVPKSGTTWLKALAFATLNRAAHPPLDDDGDDHPLRRGNPHDLVSFLEVKFMVPAGEDVVGNGGGSHAARDVLEELPSPRLLATHAPYSLLPRCMTGEDSGCRFVYICRDPKDVLVSFCKYNEKTAKTMQKLGGLETPVPAFEQVFELFCDGRSITGPQWRHALEYWEESKRRPEKVLFLRYEEVLRDPVGNVKKLASFMGCPSTAEEEEAGVVQKIVELCSLDSLKNSEVNKNGSTMLGLKNHSFFRKGAAGDWRNHMTPEMAARLDRVVEEALQGSGLKVTNSI